MQKLLGVVAIPEDLRERDELGASRGGSSRLLVGVVISAIPWLPVC